MVCNVETLARLLGRKLVSRNPLTGLCGLQRGVFSKVGLKLKKLSQSPYGAMWFATWKYADFSLAKFYLSQSPYGAKWFATLPS